jgi:tRNA (adenine22-N1)-methyltransferase
MGYGKRIDTLCSLLVKTDVFAAVGCDHGYCTEYMLKNGFCEQAIASDISEGSLKKAENLLAPYIAAGRVTPVVGGGFAGVPSSVGEVLIAGMGGAEIVKILSDEDTGFLPRRFLLQPMHDTEKLRRYLVENGAVLERDFTFFANGKYYDTIVGRKGEDGEKQAYTELEYEFGRENLRARGEDFLQRVRKHLVGIDGFLAAEGLSESNREGLLRRKKKLEGVLHGDGI